LRSAGVVDFRDNKFFYRALEKWEGEPVKIKNKSRAVVQFVLVLLLAVVAQSASAQSLTTTFNDNNGCAGNYFDLEVIGGSAITISSFDVNMESGTHDVSVYWRPGTSFGFEGNATGWLLLGSDNGIASNGGGNPTPVAVGGLTLQPGETYGFLVGTTDGNYINYTNGGGAPAVYSNADIRLTTDVSICDPLLTGGLNIPRIWNGTVYYGDALEPAEGTAVIAVDKVFDDGNNETEVTLTLQCTSGSYAPASVTVLPGESQAEHIFVIDQIPTGAPNRCTVVETPVDGYDAYYRCPQEASTSDVDGDVCGTGVEEMPAGTTACGWLDVAEGDVNRCYITNAPTPVDVDVTKVWDIFGEGGEAFGTDVRLTLHCDAEIVGGEFVGGGEWIRNKRIKEGDYVDEDGEYTGQATVTYKVIPDWYRTANNPDNQKYTKCWVTENIKADAVEIENGCGDTEETSTLRLTVGQGDECTVTNTVFFEGIPTLSQYGMALMALLMLGVGFIGMRRFI